MKLKIIHLAILLTVNCIVSGQSGTDINRTDQRGKKQGTWIKKYPGGNIMYQATFRDDKPVGEFRRYNADNTIKSVLIYSDDSRVADATIYHTNGFVASKGRYVDQLKEGKWQFFSSSTSGCLINEEIYSGNLKNGPSLKYFPDNTLAEKINYRKGIKDGEWLQYHANGKLFLKASYLNGDLEGSFEAWYDTGLPQYKGTYRKSLREGKWQFFDEKGALKYEIIFTNGATSDRHLDMETARFLERIEKNKGKIPDPEKTGEIQK